MGTRRSSLFNEIIICQIIFTNQFPNREAISNLFELCGRRRKQQNLQFIVQAVFGGCYRWVLDAVCETVEWLDQPLGFESLALRPSLDNPKIA